MQANDQDAKNESAPISVEQKARIDDQLLDLASANLLGSLVAALVGVSGLALRLPSNREFMQQWVTAMVLLVVVRFAFDRAYRRERKSVQLFSAARRRCWYAVVGAGQIVSGILWAAMCTHLLPIVDAEARMLITVVICGIAGAGAAVLAPLQWPGRVYLTTLILPMACVYLVEPLRNPYVAVFAITFLGVMLACHRNNQKTVLQSLILKERNAELLQTVMSHHREVQQLNAGLEQRVVERTAALEQLATHDPLTGLFNRRGMMKMLDAWFELQNASELAVLFLDLDKFKEINDGIGHDVGDAVLRTIAERLRARVPNNAAIGRWGGDEFVVIIDGNYEGEAAESLAIGLRESLVPAIDFTGEPLHVGVSIGIAYAPIHGNSAMAIIRAADLAAAEVKRTQRGQVLVYANPLADAMQRRLEISRALQQAIVSDSLRVAYQPIVDCQTGRITAFEALLRWTHPTLGPVGPDEFIPIAEESSRILEIGRWVLSRACREAMKWGGDDNSPSVSVNVSVRQLIAVEFPDIVRDVLAQTGLPPTRLHLEVTESVFDAAHTTQTYKTLDTLHRLGVKIFVDDFGTGYSSLSRLQEFPLDAIKIDRVFTSRLDQQSRAVIEGAILIARSFGMHVIAEGVETLDQAISLRMLGVDAFQGYFISKPQFEVSLQLVNPVWNRTTGEVVYLSDR